MPDSKIVTWEPRRGRGLVTAFNAHSLGELWDSFQTFKHVTLEDGAWKARSSDATSTPWAPYIKTFHLYNVMFGNGTISTQLLILQSNGSLLAGGILIHSATSPYELFFETVKNRVYFAGVDNEPKIWNGMIGVLTDWGADGPSGVMGYTAFSGSSSNAQVAVGVCSVVTGGVDATVTWVSGTQFTTGASWVGKAIKIDGVYYTILSVTNATHLELTINYTGATASVAFQVQYGERTWEEPPMYAYAYYNPTTGHITNGGDVLTLSEKEMKGVAVFLTGIQTSPSLSAQGYTRIVLFRSPKDQPVLYPLPCESGLGTASIADEMIVNTGGPLTYQDNNDDDNDLGGILGRQELPDKNNKPPLLRYIAYFDGRFFGVEQTYPWRVRWSGDIAQIPLGVPEECWPEQNFDDVRSPDGYATGMQVIGTSLLVTTTRWTYFVTGSNGAYRLERLSTRGFGVDMYAIDEHPGDGSTQSASGIYAARSRQVWRHREGGTLTNLGATIQDKLDMVQGMNAVRPYVVHVFGSKKLWLGAVGIRNGNGSHDTYFYDFDQEAWYDFGLRDEGGSNHGMTAMASAVHSTTGEWQTFVAHGRPNSTVHTLLDGHSGQPYLDGMTTAVLRTQNWDGGDRNIKKTFDDFEIDVSLASSTWLVSAEFDEDFIQIPLTLVPTPGSPRYTGRYTLKYVLQQPRQFHCVNFQVTFPSVELKMFKMRMNIRPYSTGVSGQPS